MRHVQRLSREGLVKMDHFQKEPPLNLIGTTGAQGTDGNPARSECPLWVKSGHVRCTRRCPLSAKSGHCKPKGQKRTSGISFNHLSGASGNKSVNPI